MPKRTEALPGSTQNKFGRILHAADRVGRLPRPLFALLLLGLAALGGRFDWTRTGWLWLFFLLDWLLLALLPRLGRSFGPPLPPTLTLAVLRLPFALLPDPLNLLAQAAGTLLAVYALWIEPHRLTVSRQSLRSAKLPPGPPVRLLHLADLHLERLSPRERELNRLVRELAPDIIVFSGDFLNLSYNRDPLACEATRQLLREWRAPLGVYVVSGSPGVDLPDVLPGLLDGLPLRWLQDEVVPLPAYNLDLIGLTCTHDPEQDGPRLRTALASRPAETFKLLLYHTPDLAPEAAAAGVDLQLSGHTHGGQVRLPGYGALYAGSLYGKRFEAGRLAVGALTLYVSRGIGLEGKGAPRLRFLCPPEIIVWEIAGAP